VLTHLLWWYARYVVAMLVVGSVLIAATWLFHLALDRFRARRHG
jgi:hypothetical protein